MYFTRMCYHVVSLVVVLRVLQYFDEPIGLIKTSRKACYSETGNQILTAPFLISKIQTLTRLFVFSILARGEEDYMCEELKELLQGILRFFGHGLNYL